MKKTYMQSADALGTTVELRLVTSSLPLAEEWFAKLWDEIYKFEKQFSRFKEDSELTKFNNLAGKRVSISQTFETMLRKAKSFSEITNGTFNLFVLPNLQQAGYVYSMTGAKSGPDYSKRKSADWRRLEIGSRWARIPHDSAIDLGGIGKGFLADLLGQLLESEIPDYCLSLGGDMCVGGKDAESVWKIEIDSPQKNTDPQMFFSSTTQNWGIATSGAVREKFSHKQNHLINPKTGVPVTSDAICTVIAESATSADVLASCILISGEDLAKDLFRKGVIMGVLVQNKSGLDFLLGEGFSSTREEVELKNNLPSYAYIQ